MQRVTVRTQGANGGAVIGQNLPKVGEGGGIFDHGELAVSIAGIIASAEFDGIDLERLEFLKNGGQRKLREQGREDSNAHNNFCLCGLNGRRHNNRLLI